MVPNIGFQEKVNDSCKKGQKANSKKHSDLYTDENPKGTIKGLKEKMLKLAYKKR